MDYSKERTFLEDPIYFENGTKFFGKGEYQGDSMLVEE